MLSPEFEGVASVLPFDAYRSESAPPATSPDRVLAAVIPCALRRAARHAEIDRDGQVVAGALVDALRRIIASAGSLSPDKLWARVDEATKASRAAHAALNNARITLRAHRYAIYSDSAPLPASLGPLRHHGNYRGVFASMAELGNCLRGALGITSGLPPAERTALARELHLRGDIWTIEQDDVVHVFGRPGGAADMLLASERPRPDDGPLPEIATMQEAPAP